jgi:acyl dehydratase
VVLKEELPNERGLVVVSTRGLNQREEAILTLERKIVVPKRPAGESL